MDLQCSKPEDESDGDLSPRRHMKPPYNRKGKHENNKVQGNASTDLGLSDCDSVIPESANTGPGSADWITFEEDQLRLCYFKEKGLLWTTSYKEKHNPPSTYYIDRDPGGGSELARCEDSHIQKQNRNLHHREADL
jgi:hypothetical protein